MRHEAGSGGGPRAGRVRELPSGILWNGQPPPPLRAFPFVAEDGVPQIPGVDCGSSLGGPPSEPCRGGGGGLTWCPSLRGRGLASPRTQPAPADSRPLSRGGEARPASRAPSGPWRLGPRPRLSAPGTFSPRRSRRRRRRQAGGCTLTGTRTANTHVEGRPGGAQGSTRPQLGSGGHGDTRPLQRPRVAPSHARGSAKPSALPHSAAAAHSPWHGRARPRPPWRPSILQPLRRAPRLCRQPDKAPALGPFTISERWVFVTCLWAPSPTRPHMPTHPHVPAPTGRAGCKPALLLGPLRSQTHTEGHNRSASPRHVKNPPQARALGVGGLGWRPQQGFLRVGPEGLATGLASCPAPLRPSLRCSVSLPPCRALPSQPASASGWIGLCCAVSQQAGCGTLFVAVRQWSSPCHSSASPLLEGPPPRECGPNV